MAGENGHKPRFKIPPLRVPADDCPAHLGGGEEVFLHVGEWVEILPIPDFNAFFALTRVRGDDESTYAEFCQRLADRVTAWDLTDLAGDPLPQPWRNPAAIRALSQEEQGWLTTLIATGGEVARKNGSGPPADISTPTAPSRRKR
jgi:hypothetical protein